MKTIEEAKIKYCEKIASSPTLLRMDIIEQNMNAFDAGVEFAQQWINPKKQMPTGGELVQVKIQWKDHEYSYDHDKRVIADGYDDFEINQMCGLEVVGWRPINLK